MTTSSAQLAELVRKQISNAAYDVIATDQSVGKALNVSRATISMYRSGGEHMSARTFARASEILDLSPAETLEWSLTIERDRAKDEAVRSMADRCLKWLRQAAHATPVILSALLIGALALNPLHSQASALNGSAGSTSRNNVYYVKFIVPFADHVLDLSCPCQTIRPGKCQLVEKRLPS